MTVQELIDYLKRVKKSDRGREVKVWLPGSKIRLSAMLPEPYPPHNHILIEGNLDPGSALGEF